MRLFHVYAPGVAKPHDVLAEDEDGAIADAVYAWGLNETPAGIAVTSEHLGAEPCFSKT